MILKGPIAGALYAPEGGVIEPYSVVFALVDTAKLNGVDFKTSFKVVSAKFNDQTWEITSANNQSIKAKYVVNAAGLFADEVSAIFGGEEFFNKTIERDKQKHELCKQHGIRILYFCKSGANYIYPVFQTYGELLKEIMKTE